MSKVSEARVKEARALNRGRQLAALESAQKSIELAIGMWDLLSPHQLGRLNEARDILVGLQQQLWSKR